MDLHKLIHKLKWTNHFEIQTHHLFDNLLDSQQEHPQEGTYI